MKKLFLIYPLLLHFSSLLFSQNKSDSIRVGLIKNYYQLAIKFKEGKALSMNYDSAFNYFSKAAALGDPQSIYAVAYMFYKGLGCKQNYDTAAQLFSKGAALGKDNSLYFYGLCWRNGYGRPKNEDSARYYLQKSADLGYRQAIMELESKVAENSNDSAAKVLLTKLDNAAIPDKTMPNHFTKIQPRLPSKDIIAGDYNGWLIQYDWSGKYIIQIKKLFLNLKYSDKQLTGKWIENDSDTAKINGVIVEDSVVFNKTSYGRTDHYSPSIKIKYNFQNAKLNLLQAGDSIFMAGDVDMFSPIRGEPSKPMFVVLARSGLKNLDSSFFKNLALSAYPNPFINTLTVQFNLIKAGAVRIELLNIDGSLIYQNDAGVLQKGTYTIPISGLAIAKGMYLIKLVFEREDATIKVIKQ